MPSSISFRESADRPGQAWRTLALWSGVLAGPLAWLFLLEANYVLSYVSCGTQHVWFLHAVTVAALVVVALGGLWGWRTGGRSSNDRERWMACAGAGMSVFFLVVIASIEVPLLTLRPCV